MEKAIKELLKLNIKTTKELDMAKRKIAKKFGTSIMSNAQIIKELQIFGDQPKLKKLLFLLRKRAVRTLSGIAPVAVLTKYYPCPGECAYCPTEKNVPQSYLSNEPAVMRAIRCGYDPYVQVQDRLRALEANGHEPTKIELIVIGGTWSSLPERYKYWYISECFQGANDYGRQTANNICLLAGKKKQKCKNMDSKIKNQKSKNFNIEILKDKLNREQKRNESAKYKIIGITFETRPDMINKEELWEMRELGCTRVELGVQAVSDKILTQNKRGHGVKEIVCATKLLKDFGFKVTYHFMPGLPGSSSKNDVEMYKKLFTDSQFQPDQIKFYPTVVTRGSLLYKWWKQGKYKPYSNQVLENLIIKCKKITPEHARIIRLIRDIPGESIIAGNMVTNLRQVMQQGGLQCRCIRCREARQLRITNYELRITNYKSSGGEEYFIQAESRDRKTLYGFCRLRINKNSMISPAIIRELHVYGELVSVGDKKKNIQHIGLGKKLMQEAEKIAVKYGAKRMAVISGVGVRNYYRKLGYRLNKTYLIKSLQK